jgi:hypothetical protein
LKFHSDHREARFKEIAYTPSSSSANPSSNAFASVAKLPKLLADELTLQLNGAAFE